MFSLPKGVYLSIKRVNKHIAYGKSSIDIAFHPIGQNQPCDKQDGVVTDGDAEDGESFYLGIPHDME